MRTRLVQPFAAVLGDPMLRNGYALIVSATATQVLAGPPAQPADGRLVYDSHIYLPSVGRGTASAEEGP